MAAAVTLLLAAAVLFSATIGEAKYIESVAANVDGNEKLPRASLSQKHEVFVPLVSFQCGYRNKFIDKNGKWRDDSNKNAGCLQGKYDILKYCKRVYPNLEITNIVEYSHMSHINNWCKEDNSASCKHQFTVRPYRCIVGEFVSESLQVPSRCRFSHIAGRTKCNDYKYWSLKAESECGLKTEEDTHQSMKLHSFAILEPCGLSMFRGVEFVCCPKSVEEKIEKVVDLEKDIDEDDYDDDDENSSESDTSDDEDNKEKTEQDPYFKDDSSNAISEHERFRDAEERLEKKHRKKVTKVITEWSELFERYNKMKATDPKGAEEYKREMTARFRKTVAALEEENKEQRTQIEELHDERVQSALNEKKRQATHDYRAALAKQVGASNKNNVLKTLKNYIKAEERDRTHMLNRYRHLLRSDPEAAVSFEPILLHRLRYIDLRINGTLAMLHDFPELEKQIRPIAIDFWNNYRRDNTPEMTKDKISSSGSLIGGGEEQTERLIRLYKQTYERTNPGATEVVSYFDSGNEDKTGKLAEYRMAAKSAATVTEKNKTHKSAPNPSTVRRTPTITTSTRRSLPEDSDEDQFDDDDESEQDDISTNTKKPNQKSDAVITRALSRLENSLVKELPTKVLSQSKYNYKEEVTKKKESESDKTDSKDSDDDDDDNDDDDSDSSEASEGEYEVKNDKGVRERNMNIAIETIVSAPVRVHGKIEDVLPAYSRQDMLVAYNNDFGTGHRQSSLLASLTNNTNFFAVGMVFCACVILVLGLIVNLKRRSSRHSGFVEVDVCTPEERHIAGMQVNGYENPTYSYFDGAKVSA